MKKNLVFIAALLISSSLLWQCTKKSEDSSLDLKTSLNNTSARLNVAINEISNTQGYKIITLQDESDAQAASVQNTVCYDSIDLANINGIYEYKPVSFSHWCFSCYDKLFQKTGQSDSLIIKMPKEKLFFPYRFHNMLVADSTLKNNFKITTTDYHYYLSKGYIYDYRLSAGFALESVNIGNLDILSSRSDASHSEYAAKFTFDNGYEFDVNSTSGDTAVSSFALSDKDGVLLKETVKRIKTEGSKHREKEYTLTIGNIDIKKTVIKDSIEIYVGGILQTNAKVEFIDNDSVENHSICNKRDIQITFDDGTVAKVSELISPALTTLSTLVESMQNIYFASKVVDYIAWSITKNKDYIKEGVR